MRVSERDFALEDAAATGVDIIYDLEYSVDIKPDVELFEEAIQDALLHR